MEYLSHQTVRFFVNSNAINKYHDEWSIEVDLYY